MNHLKYLELSKHNVMVVVVIKRGIIKKEMYIYIRTSRKKQNRILLLFSDEGFKQTHTCEVLGTVTPLYLPSSSFLNASVLGSSPWPAPPL